MRTKKVTRHYCDHCSKGMFTIQAMMAHEAICFSNPKRSCYLCDDAMDDVGAFAKEFAKRHGIMKPDRTEPFEDAGKLSKEQVDEIRKAVDNCPACILAVLKQSGGYAFDHFNYKEEKGACTKRRDREHWEGVGF